MQTINEKTWQEIYQTAGQIDRYIKIMEICGTHTMSIYKYGFKSLLPKNIKLISGPGCPVCVTAQEDIDALLQVAQQNDVLICCYGDMLKVPGSNSSLAYCDALLGNVRVVGSAMDAVTIALQNSRKTVLFWAVGFETTAPMTALAVLEAKKYELKNFKVFCNHKTMPSVIDKILTENNKIDALLCPGHVAVITGEKPFRLLPVPAVISGFEQQELLTSINLLLKMLCAGQIGCQNNYRRFVRSEGNNTAQAYMEKVFEKCDARWRGLGLICGSGLKLKKEFQQFNAEDFFSFKQETAANLSGCLCGEIIKGNYEPLDCPHFGIKCTPMMPLGPCMVSSEGACAAYYKYRGN